MSEYRDLIGVDDLADGAMTMVELDGHPLLVAHVGDTFYATDNKCPHLGGHLASGVLSKTVVTCPRHHSQFDLTDGHVVRWTDWSPPMRAASELLRPPRPLTMYEVKAENGRLLVGPPRPSATSD